MTQKHLHPLDDEKVFNSFSVQAAAVLIRKQDDIWEAH